MQRPTTPCNDAAGNCLIGVRSYENVLRRLGCVRKKEHAVKQLGWREWRDQEALRLFLRTNGFRNLEAPRRTWIFRTFPLHSAARQNDLNAVQLLLRVGADPRTTEYKGRSPKQVAMICDVSGSHAAVIDTLVDVIFF